MHIVKHSLLYLCLFLLEKTLLGVESNILPQTQVILTLNKDGLCPVSRFWVGAGSGLSSWYPCVLYGLWDTALVSEDEVGKGLAFF